MSQLQEEVERGEQGSKSAVGPQAYNVSPYVLQSQLDINNSPLDTKASIFPISKTTSAHTSTPIHRSHSKLKSEKVKSSDGKSIKVVAASLRSRCKTEADFVQAFEREESKILNIVRCQKTTVLAFSQMNSYTDGDLTISLRELSYWQSIALPKLDNLKATKLAIKNARSIRYSQESLAGSRDLILAKMASPKCDVKKLSVDLDEIPSFLQNLLAYHRILNLVSSIDPSSDLKLTKLEIILFLKSIRMSSSSEIGKGLIAKIAASGSISFAELCRISFDLGFVSLDIKDSISQLSRSWDFHMQKPAPKPPIVRRIKSHDEVFAEMQSKILKQTRDQDTMSASIVPYMVKSRLHKIKQRQRQQSLSADVSVSALAGLSKSQLCGTIGALWGQGDTPRNSQSSAISLMTSPTIASRTQRSFEQGSVMDSRRKNPLYVDTQNGETIYDMPVYTFDEYMKHCPIADEPFKRIVDQQELNPLAFATSRTPRLYGLHTHRPGVVRRDFFCSSQSNTFFHNVDINIRRQYRPCTAGSVRPLQNSSKEAEDYIMPGWCFGAVPWNGKSTELPKYSGDIGYFEPNQFKKRFNPGKSQVHLWTATSN
jgi:hypothetical protein